jgi:hypothetical protein
MATVDSDQMAGGIGGGESASPMEIIILQVMS